MDTRQGLTKIAYLLMLITLNLTFALGMHMSITGAQDATNDFVLVMHMQNAILSLLGISTTNILGLRL